MMIFGWKVRVVLTSRPNNRENASLMGKSSRLFRSTYQDNPEFPAQDHYTQQKLQMEVPFTTWGSPSSFVINPEILLVKADKVKALPQTLP